MLKAIKTGLKKAESQLLKLESDLVVLIDGDQTKKVPRAADLKKAWCSFTVQLDNNYLNGEPNQPGLI